MSDGSLLFRNLSSLRKLLSVLLEANGMKYGRFSSLCVLLGRPSLTKLLFVEFCGLVFGTAAYFCVEVAYEFASRFCWGFKCFMMITKPC